MRSWSQNSQPRATHEHREGPHIVIFLPIRTRPSRRYVRRPRHLLRSKPVCGRPGEAGRLTIGPWAGNGGPAKLPALGPLRW